MHCQRQEGSVLVFCGVTWVSQGLVSIIVVSEATCSLSWSLGRVPSCFTEPLGELWLRAWPLRLWELADKIYIKDKHIKQGMNEEIFKPVKWCHKNLHCDGCWNDILLLQRWQAGKCIFMLESVLWCFVCRSLTWGFHDFIKGVPIFEHFRVSV